MAAWLSLLLVAGMMPSAVLAGEHAPRREPVPASPLARYNDLPDQAYYLEALALLTEIGVIEPNEDGGFAPNARVTRAELAVWLAKSLGLAPVPGSVFADVPADAAEAPYIRALHEAGLIRGYGDGAFRGDRPITRAEAAVLFAGIAGRKPESRHAAAFADVRETDWFAGAAGALANMRVFQGKAKGVFAPLDHLTRGEAAVIVYRLLFELKRIEALDADAVTINGYAYRWDDTLAGLFREENRDALLGAAIRFENDGDTIVKVTGLLLQNGSTPAGDPPVLDGGDAVIAGNLYVAADAVSITNLIVGQHLVITPAARKSVLLGRALVAGGVLLAPDAEATEGRRYVFLYSDAAFFARGITIARHAAVVRAEGFFGADGRDMAPHASPAGARKSGKPVVIAANPYFDASYYLDRNPDLLEAILQHEEAWKHYLDLNAGFTWREQGRKLSPWFDAMDYLEQQQPDLRFGGQSPSAFMQHYMEYGNNPRPIAVLPSSASDIMEQDAGRSESGGIGADGQTPGADAFQFGLIDGRLYGEAGDHPARDQGREDPAGDERPVHVSLHFVSSAEVEVAGQTKLELVGSFEDTVSVKIQGDADQLEIDVVSLSGDGTLVLEISGEVGKIVISGHFDGDIVLTGMGKVGGIETGEGLPEQAVRVDDGLEAGELNGRPVSQPDAPSGPPAPPAPPAPQPGANEPSVTKAVYDGFADYAVFGLETSDAAKVYYYALEAEFGGPDRAEDLKELAASGSGMAGTAEVSGGKAGFTVTDLRENRDYVLYAAVEAPDGTLSEVYRHPFRTESVSILDVTYEVEPLGPWRYQARFNVKVNALAPVPVYWLLTERPGIPDPEEVGNGCPAEVYGQECGRIGSEPGTGIVELMVEVPTGNWRFHFIAEGSRLSPVYTVNMVIE